MEAKAGEKRERESGEECADEETVMRLSEVVAAEEEAEEAAVAVLGASDAEVCSYPQGYVPRQALYSCLSCQKEGEVSGVCLACSLRCHASHDLVELYTKRNFRCDCGNHLQTTRCLLCPDKDTRNSSNRYNHNFHGRYCSCDAPYPEPEGTVADSQCQCVLCEDWFHTRHLHPDKTQVDNKVDWEELVCRHCTAKHPRLAHYAPSRLHLLRPQRDAKGNLQCRISAHSTETPSASGDHPNTAPLTFPDDAWRAELCRCAECGQEEEVEWLLSEGDSVGAYERRGRESVGASRDEALAAALQESVPNPHAQRQLIQGFQNMKDGLSDFLKSLGPDQVVSKDHIDQFFLQLNAKKPRLQ